MLLLDLAVCEALHDARPRFKHGDAQEADVLEDFLVIFLILVDV